MPTESITAPLMFIYHFNKPLYLGSALLMQVVENLNLTGHPTKPIIASRILHARTHIITYPFLKGLFLHLSPHILGEKRLD